jgi:hypothetical protein
MVRPNYLTPDTDVMNEAQTKNATAPQRRCVITAQQRRATATMTTHSSDDDDDKRGTNAGESSSTRAIRIRRRPHVLPCHHHHLPRVQTRAGGGSFQLFQHLCHHHLPRVQPSTRRRWFFSAVSTSLPPPSPPHPTKRELEVFSTPLPPPPPASHPNASWRWFSPVVPCSNVSATATTSLASKREPEVVLFSCFNVSATTTTSLASKRELEVVFLGVPMHPPPPPPPSHPNASWRWFFRLFQRIYLLLPRIQM